MMSSGKLLVTVVLFAAAAWLGAVSSSRGGSSNGDGVQATPPAVIRGVLDAQQLALRYTPKGKEAVYGRLLGVAAVVVRDQIEWYFRRPADPENPRLEIEFNAHLADWVRTRNVRQHISIGETGLLDRPMGGWSSDELSSHAYTPERLAVLMWSLGLMKAMPTYDVPVSGLFGDPIGLLKSIDSISGKPQLRSREELLQQFKIASAWVERSRMHDSVKRGSTSYNDPATLAEVEALAKQAVVLGAIPTVYKGDFPAFGEPYRKILDRYHVQSSWISGERLTALAWVLGLIPEWDEAPAKR